MKEVRNLDDYINEKPFNFKGMFTSLLLIVGIFGILTYMTLLNANDDYIYILTSPTGETNVIRTSGYHIITPMSKIDKWEKNFNVDNTKQIRFKDGIGADIKINMNITVNDFDDDEILNIYHRYNDLNHFSKYITNYYHNHLRNLMLNYNGYDYFANNELRNDINSLTRTQIQLPFKNISVTNFNVYFDREFLELIQVKQMIAVEKLRSAMLKK